MRLRKRLAVLGLVLTGMIGIVGGSVLTATGAVGGDLSSVVDDDTSVDGDGSSDDDELSGPNDNKYLVPIFLELDPDDNIDISELSGAGFILYDNDGDMSCIWSADELFAGDGFYLGEDCTGIWRLVCDFVGIDGEFDIPAVEFDAAEMWEDAGTVTISVSRIVPDGQPVRICCDKWSDYISNTVEALGISFELRDSSDNCLAVLDSDKLSSGAMTVYVDDDIAFDDEMNGRSWTVTPVGVPADMAGSLKTAVFKADHSVFSGDGIQLDYFSDDKNFYRQFDIMTVSDNEITICTMDKYGVITGFYGFKLCNMGVVDGADYEAGFASVSVPCDKRVVIEDVDLGVQKDVDTTVSELSDIKFISSNMYQIFTPIEETLIGSGYSFMNDVWDGSWVTKIKSAAGIAALNNGTGHLVVKVMNDDKTWFEFYWLPPEDAGYMGTFIGKDYCDSYKYNARECNVMSAYLVQKGVYKNVMTGTPSYWLLWDRNHDGKVNVFDYILAKRTVLERNDVSIDDDILDDIIKDLSF